MTSCRILLAAACLGIAAPAVAGTRPEASAPNRPETTPGGREAAPIPLRWMPAWLAQVVRNAIDDATDPRDRAAER